VANLNKSTFDRLIEFVQLDATAWGEREPFRFVNTSTFATDHPDLGVVQFNGVAWTPMAFTASGWQRGGENLVQPTIDVPDFGGALAVTLAKYDDAPGAPVTRYLALAEDVIANNPQAAFQTERYLLDSVASDGQVLTLTLATHADFRRAKFPNFKMGREHYPGLGSNLLR
jgi:phage-related protein